MPFVIRERVRTAAEDDQKADRMNRIKAVIFDFDGVLVDSEVISLSELNKSLQKFGLEKDWQDLLATFLGHSNGSIADYIRKTSGKDPEPEFPEEWARRIFDRFSRDLRLVPGSLGLLDRLDHAGIAYSIASGSSPDRLDYALDCVGLKDRFKDMVFSADQVERGKPAPDIFLHAAAKMGVEPADCLVVEDGIAGTIGARAAEVGQVIGFVGASHLKGFEAHHAEQLQTHGADRIIRSLNEIRL